MTRMFDRKPVSIGIVMAAVFLLVDAAVPQYVGIETLILGFAACLLLICSALVETPRDGLICGFTALVAQNLGTFAKYVVATGAGVAAAVASYSLLLTLMYPIAGMVGGYLGGKLTVTGRRPGSAERGTKAKAVKAGAPDFGEPRSGR